RPQHLARREVPRPEVAARGWPRCRQRLRLARRMPHELRDDHNDDALKEAGPQEGLLVTLRPDRPSDERDEQCGTAAEGAGDDSRGETAAIGEPLQRRSHAAAVDERGADAGKYV